MRNTAVFLLFLILSSVSVSAQTISFSGKITNLSDGKLSIRGESFFKEFTVKADGTFSETLTIAYNGNYTLYLTDNKLPLYLAKGMKLYLTADNTAFFKTLKFTGKGSVENEYVARKVAIGNNLNNEVLFSADETKFLSGLKEYIGNMQKNYADTKFEDADFKARELKNIWFSEQLYLQNYPEYHAHYANIEGFKPSDSFPKVDPSIDYDDESQFVFSAPYRQMSYTHFNEKVNKMLKPEDQFTYPYALAEIKKYKSPSIKNAMVKALSYEIGTANPNSSELYKELMVLTTSKLFKQEMTDKYTIIKALVPGAVSPGFDYENHKGGKTSLASLKGSYVYIDVWATWCGPCRQEIPALQKVEEQYKDKNIKFVSISIDPKKDHDKWQKMVSDKKMGGIQLFADNANTSQFAKDYAIDSIPRFILVGPDGNIINANAPPPSDAKLQDLLGGLKI